MNIFTEENLNKLKDVCRSIIWLADESVDGALMHSQLISLGDNIKEFVDNPIIKTSGVLNESTNEAHSTKKYLVNCSMVHYPNGTYVRHPNYALIIKTNNDETDLFWHVYDALVSQGFKMQKKQYVCRSDIHFTIQPI